MFMWIFPFINPDWPDRYEWMSFDTRFTLHMLTGIWDIVVGIAMLFGLIVLCFVGYWKFMVGFIVGLVLLGIGKFIHGIYKQYRLAHPVNTPRAVLERKRSFFKFTG